MKQHLKLQDYEVQVHLGCSEAERKYLQPVRFIFEIEFDQTVKGAMTDDLNDTVDYVKLTELMSQVSKAKPYKLVEHLGQEVFLKLHDYLNSYKIGAMITLSTQKVRVPIDNLKNGVIFTCSAKL